MRGLILLDRDILDHPSFALEPFTEREAFIWMIGEASYSDRTVRTKKGTVNLKRGELTASTRFMADKWGWKEPRVRRFLNRLKTDEMIDAQSDAVQTVVTICNYSKYQDFGNYRDAASDAVATRGFGGSSKNSPKIDAVNDAVTTQPNPANIKGYSEAQFPQATQLSTQQRRSNDAVATQTRTPEETPDVTPEGEEIPQNPQTDIEVLEPEQPQELILSAPVGPDDFTAAVAMWNAMADRQENIRTVQKSTEVRKTRMKARLKECGGLSGWQIAIEKIEGSDFLLGLTGGKWVANFDWVLSEGNFTKLMEGNYDQLNRKGVEQARGAAGALNQAFDDIAAELNDGGRL